MLMMTMMMAKIITLKTCTVIGCCWCAQQLLQTNFLYDFGWIYIQSQYNPISHMPRFSSSLSVAWQRTGESCHVGCRTSHDWLSLVIHLTYMPKEVQFLPHDIMHSALYAMLLCLAGYLSHSCTVWLNISSNFFNLAPPFQFMHKNSS